MANCVLCGQKLGMFDKVKIDFHNTKQSVCSDCANRLDNTVGPDRRSCSAKFWIPPIWKTGRTSAPTSTLQALPWPAAPSPPETAEFLHRLRRVRRALLFGSAQL